MKTDAVAGKNMPLRRDQACTRLQVRAPGLRLRDVVGELYRAQPVAQYGLDGAVVGFDFARQRVCR